MELERTKQILRALDGALAVFRDARGRRSASDIRVQSMISAARLVLAQRTLDDAMISPGDTNTSTSRPPMDPTTHSSLSPFDRPTRVSTPPWSNLR